MFKDKEYEKELKTQPVDEIEVPEIDDDLNISFIVDIKRAPHGNGLIYDSITFIDEIPVCHEEEVCIELLKTAILLTVSATPLLGLHMLSATLLSYYPSDEEDVIETIEGNGEANYRVVSNGHAFEIQEMLLSKIG